MRAAALFFALLCAAPFAFAAQGSAPLPDAPSLFRDVVAHQQKLEKTRESYTYLRHTATNEVDKNGRVKKTDTREAEVFYVNSHEIERTVRRNGKPLSSGETDKENDRVKKEIEKAENTPPYTAINENTVSIGRMLQIMKISAPRRETMDNRPMIVYNFTGDPHAKTHGRAEDASKKIAGTLWIDEGDHQVRRLVASFDGDYSIGFGLFVLAKGSSFSFDQKLINNELWLPTDAHVHVVGKALGFVGYRAEIQITDGNYQRFHTAAEQVQ